MLRLAFDFIITWRETRTRPNAYLITVILFFPVITWRCFNSFHKLWIIVYTIMYIFNL